MNNNTRRNRCNTSDSTKSLENATLRAAAATMGIDSREPMIVPPVANVIEDDNDEDDDGGLFLDEDDHEMQALDGRRRRRISKNGFSSSSWFKEGKRRVRADKVRRQMRIVTVVAGVGGFLFGYDTGVISGALLPLRDTFDLTPTQQETIVSITILSAFLSSLILGPPLNHRYGRRIPSMTSSLLFLIGSTLLASSWNYHSLVIGRCIIGLGIGLSSVTIPVYLAEIANPNHRGVLVTLNALMVVSGQFLAGMVDGLFYGSNGGWRIMLGLASVPSLGMLMGFVFCLPESPRWLVMEGEMGKAMDVLRLLRDTDEEANEELVVIMDGVCLMDAGADAGADAGEVEMGEENEEEEDARSVDSNGLDDGEMIRTRLNGRKRNALPLRKRFMNMIKDAPTRRALCLGCGMMALQQLCGINTVMYYAASIYEMSEFSERTSIWLSGFTALSQVFGILISIHLVERAGRRKLVLISLFFVMLSLVGLGFSFFLSRILSPAVLIDNNNNMTQSCSHQPAMVWNGITSHCYDCVLISNCGYCDGYCLPGTIDGPFDNNSTTCPSSTWSYKSCTNNQIGSYLSILFMVTYLLSFGIGMGGMPWTINSEIYRTQHRTLAMSMSTGTNWICNYVVSRTFLSLSSASVLTAYGAFWLYGMVSLVGLVGLAWSMPETKGLTLEEIVGLFVRVHDDHHDDHHHDHHHDHHEGADDGGGLLLLSGGDEDEDERDEQNGLLIMS